MALGILGNTTSGKTSYILGLYHTLLHGPSGDMFLHADPDLHYELQLQWDSFNSNGEPPGPTSVPVKYGFTFSMGHVIAKIDLTDYRGGALYEPVSIADHETNRDTAEMLRWLDESDAILVVVDAAHFRDPVATARQRQEVMGKTAAGPISNYLSHLRAAREVRGAPLPPIVLVLTKSDLIDHEMGGVARQIDDVAAEVREMFRAAFQDDVPSAFYPVSLGHLNEHGSGGIPAGQIEPRGLHGPLIFALSHFVDSERQACGERVVRARNDYEDLLKEYTVLARRSRIVRWFWSRRMRALESDLANVEEILRQANDRFSRLNTDTTRLRRALEAP